MAGKSINRSFSDVPNRVVRIFLERVGAEYDKARGYPPFKRLTDDVLVWFERSCAYCGDRSGPLVAEHADPINREHAGLHAWGNVIPACKPCNKAKGGKANWRQYLRARPDADTPECRHREHRIELFRTEWGYAPDTGQLIPVAGQLYDFADQQARELVKFAVTAFQPAIVNAVAISKVEDAR